VKSAQLKSLRHLPSITHNTMVQTIIGLPEAICGACQVLPIAWGFFLVRTAYADEKDAEIWATALKKLRPYALSTPQDIYVEDADLALPEVSDSVALQGVGNGALRAAFTTGIDMFLNRPKLRGAPTWRSSVRRDAFVVVDAPSLASLLAGPAFEEGKPISPDEPFVMVVDARDPTTVPYRGGGPYTGAVRVMARNLGDFFEDLDRKPMDELCAMREYEGQIPLYDGSGRDRLVDPPEGLEGRYRFPRGTPRGVEGARAMLEQIDRAGHLWREE
jgi:hypothetical protein